MDTSRDDVGIAFRSALLSKGTKQRFSLFVLVILSVLLIFLETLQIKPIALFRSLVKDGIYYTAQIVSSPLKLADSLGDNISEHISLYKSYQKLKVENENLKNRTSDSEYLKLENNQLKQLIDEQINTTSNIISSRVMIDKQSPYLNSFIINIGTNKGIKNGMTVLHGKNFIGRIVDVNFFSSRVLLITDLNSKIPVIIEPTGYHGILSGHGKDKPTIDYLSENSKIEEGHKVYTSGKEGIFSPGIPIGEVVIEDEVTKVLLFSDLTQTAFVNIKINETKNNK